MNYYAADNFAGSGALIGTAPPFKDAAVGNWSLTTHGAFPVGGAWTRSAGGAVYTDAPQTSNDTQLGVLGAVARGSGLCNFEFSARGAFQVNIVLGGVTHRISVNQAGTVSGSVNGVTLGVSPIAPVNLSTTTVFRFEFDSTDVRTFVNGVSASRAFAGITGGTNISEVYLVHGLIGSSALENTLLDGTGLAASLVNYVNCQLNSTAGPLGSPGSTSVALTLPSLSATGGQFGHGTAAPQFPALRAVGYMADALPAPPTFWTGYVGVREVP